MRQIALAIVAFCLSVTAQTPSGTPAPGNQGFRGTFENTDFGVYLRIDFYAHNVVVPEAEVYGEMPGYFGSHRDYRKWLFTDATIGKDGQATVSIINDYGSEDLTAQLRLIGDSLIELKQDNGSTIKFAENGKWMKIPKVITFKRKKSH